MNKEAILEAIKAADEELKEIEKLIINRKNISDTRTKEFLEMIRKRIKKMRLKGVSYDADNA
ncbi:MAG: hypothetical protein LBF71_05455 [Campylobacteraceae bacterium]|jgi:Ni,Fe-hydrogenase III large subunit|nr:hypothetical protein [Campylobacteraceae bacterium]